MNMNFDQAMKYAKEQGGITQSMIYAQILDFINERINALPQCEEDPLCRIYIHTELNDDGSLWVAGMDGVDCALDKGYRFLRPRNVKTQAQMKRILKKLDEYIVMLTEEDDEPKARLSECQFIPCTPTRIC